MPHKTADTVHIHIRGGEVVTPWAGGIVDPDGWQRARTLLQAAREPGFSTWPFEPNYKELLFVLLGGAHMLDEEVATRVVLLGKRPATPPDFSEFHWRGPGPVDHHLVMNTHTNDMDALDRHLNTGVRYRCNHTVVEVGRTTIGLPPPASGCRLLLCRGQRTPPERAVQEALVAHYDRPGELDEIPVREVLS